MSETQKITRFRSQVETDPPDQMYALTRDELRQLFAPNKMTDDEIMALAIHNVTGAKEMQEDLLDFAYALIAALNAG